jgi:class 3 adenylate cyclase
LRQNVEMHDPFDDPRYEVVGQAHHLALAAGTRPSRRRVRSASTDSRSRSTTNAIPSADSNAPAFESVVRRTIVAYNAGSEALGNLMSSDPSLRVIGFDRDEYWRSNAEFVGVRTTQTSEAPDAVIQVDLVDAFQDGDFGWATLFSTFRTPEAETHLRSTAVLRLEAGIWRVIQWHNSSPVSNQQVYGVDLTTTLGDLVESVLERDGQLPDASSTEGTMTLVFIDIVDSTPFAEAVGDAVWAETVAGHEAAIGAATAAEGGTVVKFLGDGSMLAFESARGAVRSAIRIQKETAAADFAVRIGIHSGEVMRTENDLLGLTVNKAARVASAAAEGQIMISSTTRDLVGSMEGAAIGEPMTVTLKGISGTHHIVPVAW